MSNRAVLAVIVLVAFIAIGDALPFARKRMVYYQQPLAAQFYGAPQRMMYVQYVQPSQSSQTHARSTQAASALVAGQTVATGTYLEDCNHAETDTATAAGGTTTTNVEHSEDVLSAAGVHSAHSVAEAYPDAPAPPPSRCHTVEVEQTPIAADVPVAEPPTEVPLAFETENEAKKPRDFNFERNEPAAQPVAPAAELPAPAPIAPVAVPPASRYLPSKKKIYVELDEAVEPESVNDVAVAEDEENQETETEDEESDVAAAVVPVVPNARRPVAKKPVKPVKPAKAAADCSGCVKATADCSGCARAGSAGGSSKPQLPAGTFFPISFGEIPGGTIAIANAFSTGEGGSASSHAIAYGSPDAVRARVKPSKLH